MYCPRCGVENDDNAFRCVSCNEIVQPMPVQQASPRTEADIEDDPALRLLVPIGVSGLAIAAGYLGLFSVLLLPAPFAILFGVLAIRDIKRNPKKHGKWRAFFGVGMGVLGTIGLLALLAQAMWGAARS